MPSTARRAPALLLFALLPLLAGCPNQNRSTKALTRADDEDLLAGAGDALRKDAALESCKTAVEQLNVYLSRGRESKPPALTDAERDLLAKLQLSKEELAEVSRDDFSPLDAHYLESCLLFHDGVRSLNLNESDKSAPAALERARLTFAWVMREVWLLSQARRVVPPGTALRALPPSYVLRMGSATPDERAAVALAAFQQAGFDACLVGQAKDGKTPRPWAIGVLIDDQVYLFDFRSGEPAAGPGGNGIATLKQARATPELVKAAVSAAEPAAEVKDVVEASRVWLSPPLSSLAPRMRWLQTALNSTRPVVLAVALGAVVERFAKAGEKPEFYNPPGNPESPLRLLAAFLPTTEGGLDTAKPGERPYELFARALIPLGQLPALFHRNLITGDPREKMVSLYGGRFLELAMEPGKPRDLLLRGRFDDASRGLVEFRDRVDKVQQRLRQESNLEKEAIEWAEAIRRAAGAYLSLRNNPKANPDEVMAAKARMDQLSKESEKMQLLIEQAAMEPFAAAVTYELALCKHEQAERQSRDGSSPDGRRDAWKNAVGWWNNFVGQYAASPSIPPAQADHARRLLAAAQRQLAGAGGQ